MISSYVGENKEFERQYLAGELELEFTPQGTLAEKLRAGGAGIPAFFTRTGVGTLVAEGKESREFDGHIYVMERALVPDVSLVKARKADKSGNLVLPPDRAQLQPGRRDGRQDHDRRGRGARRDRRARSRRGPPARASTCIASCSTRIPRSASRSAPARRSDDRFLPSAGGDKRHVRQGATRRQEPDMAWTRDQMAARAAQELQDGFYVNLGIGMPTLVANHVPTGIEVWLQSENGLLGIGPFPTEDEVDPDLINAGKQTVTTHARLVDLRLARFVRDDPRRQDQPLDPRRDAGQREGRPRQLDDPGQDGQGHGRRDGSRRRRRARASSLMEHVAKKDGTIELKILPKCTLPLTGVGVVNRIITDLAVIDVSPRGLEVLAIAVASAETICRARPG